MNLWMITSIRLEPATPLRASSIQNLQTAMALADSGHRVLLWVARLDPGARALIQERLGRALPPGLRLLAYKPHGHRYEKKTPFHSRAARIVNIIRARLAGSSPDAVLTRSPRVIAQLRATRLLPAHTRLVLEYQYPEWALLWRQWRRRHPSAPLREAVRRLRCWRGQEDAWLGLADGILYAARGHEALLRHAGYARPAAWLPSGCLPPECGMRNAECGMPGIADGPVRSSECGMRNAECGMPGSADVLVRSSECGMRNAECGMNKEAEFDLGYVGTLTPENGLETIIDALALLPGRRLVLVGGGDEHYTSQLKNQAARLGVADRLAFAGPVNFREVRGWMQRCRVGLAPISRRQGPEKRQFASPLKLIEWMAAGVPVVATAVPSVAQFGTHGKNCLIVEPESADALAAAAARLLDDPALSAALAREGLAAAAAAAWPNRARAMAEFISSL